VRRPRLLKRRVLDAAAFPLRAFALIGGEGLLGLTSLANERYEEVARHVRGFTLDVGCGPHDTFVRAWLHGNGVGIDVFPYPGLGSEQVVEGLSTFPFETESFDSVTFIASLNHVPANDRDSELRESYRCLRPGGNVIVTMGNPLAEIVVHKVLELYDRFGSSWDVDSQRGMVEGESYFLRDSEIRSRLELAGFRKIEKRRFWTQWGLNHLLVGWKA
jgi:SAM-dependent methyltransferase